LTIAVIGNAVRDLTYRVAALPLPGETVLARSRQGGPGGKGLNQAVAARRAGAAVRFCAVVGADAAGDEIAALLAAEGIAPDGLHLWGGPSDESVLLVAESGENQIVSTAAAAGALTPAMAAALLAELAPGDSVLLQGNLSLATTRACLEEARARGLRTLLNAAPVAFDHGGLWPLVDLALVNEAESRTLTGDAAPGAAAAALRAAGAGTVVVTLGAAGAMLAGPDGMRAVAAPPVAAVDSAGAGDVLCGVLAAALDRGLAPLQGLRWAVAAAALAVTLPGALAAIPSAAELVSLRAASLADAA
jgi:ribokinase